MKTLQINTNPSYNINFRQRSLTSDALAQDCQDLANRWIIIADENVAQHYAQTLQATLSNAGIRHDLLTFAPGEASKTRETKAALEDQMLQLGCSRDAGIIALGGGITTDLAGFIAATYCRGIPAIYIPTSLLAMVDASIGGKTGVNTAYGKNLIGTFTQPQQVIIDTTLLQTLPQAEFTNGLVEMIKHALIADQTLFQQLTSPVDSSRIDDLIYQSCQIKRDVVEKDTQEKGLRQILNFGHTIGHAIEAASDYQIRHGEAVAVGMLVESYISVQRGLLDQAVLSEICEVYRQQSVPLHLPEKKYDDYLVLDKKNINQNIHSVLLCGVGEVHVHEQRYAHALTVTELKQASQWCYQQLKSEMLCSQP